MKTAIRIMVMVLLMGCHTDRQLVRHKAKDGGVSLRLRSIGLREGLLWLSFEVCNRSAFDFRVDWMTFSIRQRRQTRRMAMQEISIEPLFAQQPAVIPGDSTVILSYGMMPRVPGKQKELVVELRERNGDRRIRMTIGGNELIKARKEQ